MKRIKPVFMLSALMILLWEGSGLAQQKIWTLEDCIQYALVHNVSVQKANLSIDKNQLYVDQAEANRLPSLTASARQNFSWDKNFDPTTGKYGSSSGSNNSNYSVNSSVSLFNGMKLTNKIKQSRLDLESGHLYSEEVKESISLNVLNAYLQVLYAYESVSNAEKQIESTTQQLNLAKERLELGAISMSDFLQIKSELAAEKSTLASAKSNLNMSKVTLMQMMELPVEDNFDVTAQNLDSLLIGFSEPDAQEIFNQALGIKPQIKNAQLAKELAQLDIKIAKADALPNLSMSAGLSTAYSSLNANSDYLNQLEDRVSPAIGLSLSIPIFQKKQIKTNVAIAKISVTDSELSLIDTQNQLRKEIEQACADVVAAQSRYLASIEQNNSTRKAYEVTNEKYNQGLVSSVDFLVQKNNLINVESQLLQSKFNLIFSYKVLDFYKGIPLAL